MDRSVGIEAEVTRISSERIQYHDGRTREMMPRLRGQAKGVGRK